MHECNDILFAHQYFMPCFKVKVLKDSKPSKTLILLTNGLKFGVRCCIHYENNSCTFYMNSLDEKNTIQNSGVSLETKSLQFLTSNDHIMHLDQ